MNFITTTSFLPPPILQNFDVGLLSMPAPKFYDDAETLYLVYQYIKRKLQKKTYRCAIRDMKFIELEREFLDLHERTTSKEKEFKEKTGKSFHGPFDYLEYTGRHYKKVFGKIRSRR